jgi:hypothetical protein
MTSLSDLADAELAQLIAVSARLPVAMLGTRPREHG